MANEYGVRGGIEGAFMSTTVDRQVAMNYAASGTSGIVFEIQQGMVDRGAEVSFLSQYPHEREIVFAPLAGFEVKYTRVEGGVLVVVVSLSINLTASTIEQVSAASAALSDLSLTLVASSHPSPHTLASHPSPHSLTSRIMPTPTPPSVGDLEAPKDRGRHVRPDGSKGAPQRPVR